MEISIRFESQLRLIAGTDEMKLALPDSASVLDALRGVGQHAGDALQERLQHADGTPVRSVLVFVNNQAVAYEQFSSRTLHDRDVVLLIPPISGG